jgi:hypothetical protein
MIAVLLVAIALAAKCLNFLRDAAIVCGLSAEFTAMFLYLPLQLAACVLTDIVHVLLCTCKPTAPNFNRLHLAVSV